MSGWKKEKSFGNTDLKPFLPDQFKWKGGVLILTEEHILSYNLRF